MRALASSLEASRTFEAPFLLKTFEPKRRSWPEGPAVSPHHRHSPAQPAECAQDTATSTETGLDRQRRRGSPMPDRCSARTVTDRELRRTRTGPRPGTPPRR